VRGRIAIKRNGFRLLSLTFDCLAEKAFAAFTSRFARGMKSTV
jgi:hypothetical protein